MVCAGWASASRCVGPGLAGKGSANRDDAAFAGRAQGKSRWRHVTQRRINFLPAQPHSRMRTHTHEHARACRQRASRWCNDTWFLLVTLCHSRLHIRHRRLVCWLVGWEEGKAGWLEAWLVGGFVGMEIGWLVSWLVGWWVGWLAGWLVGVGGLVGWLVGMEVGWLVCWFVGCLPMHWRNVE